MNRFEEKYIIAGWSLVMLRTSASGAVK